MAAPAQLAARPGPTDDYTAPSRYRSVGLGLAFVGLMGAAVSVVGNFVAAGGIDAQNGFRETLAWTFGLSIFSFGVIKISIAIILMGIIVRLWFRVDSVRDSLATLRGHGGQPASLGPVKTEWGTAKVTSTAPKLLPIHRMARTMWRPMLAMGAMALTVGLISSWVWAGEAPGTESARQAAAFTQGVEFLGETMLLSGIAFLLGTIMAGLRSGGGEVQASLGWAIGFTLAIVEAGTGRDQLGDLQTLGNLFPAFMFIGFLGVFSAISFAIARILGVFRRGGGEVQEAAGSEVQTLRMPMTAKAMLLFMMMGMMVMGLGISLNFIAAGSYDGVNPADILDNAQMAAAASGFRRIGVAMYLTGIAFGLGTIIEVLRFQAVRIREVAAEHGHVHS